MGAHSSKAYPVSLPRGSERIEVDKRGHVVRTSRLKGQATPLLHPTWIQDVSWDNPNSGMAPSHDTHPGSGPSKAGEPGQLNRDPRLMAIANRLLGNGKASWGWRPGSTHWAVADWGENPQLGSRGKNPLPVSPHECGVYLLKLLPRRQALLGGNTSGSLLEASARGPLMGHILAHS